MKYIALFRGINVGGKNIVKMAALKQLFTSLGFGQVQTYIQSGNVIFDSDETPAIIISNITKAFEATYGFTSALTLRSEQELDTIVCNLPFTPQEISEAEAADANVQHLYVYFLDSEPDLEAVKQLCAAHTGADLLRTGKRELYLLCHKSIRDSKLAASLAKLNMPMTARNWKTTNKLYEIVKQ